MTDLPKSEGPNRNFGLASQFLVSIIAAIVVVGIAAGINHAWPIFGDSGGDEGSAAVVAGTPSAQPTAKPLVAVDIDPGDNPSKGPDDAKVTIVEFSDFQCPYCARFVQETLPQIDQNYGDKVKFVFMNFPLSQIHANAEKAAEASECANDQDAFWGYHDKLFQNQSALEVSNLKAYAEQLGLDTAKFNECLDSGSKEAEVSEDMATATKAAQEAGLDRFGTPAFFINGKHLAGAQPYENFKAAIDEAMSEAG